MAIDKTHLENNLPQTPSFVRKDQRGLFVEIVNEGPWETIIHGSMRKGAEMGNHYHRECRAFFYLISGKATVITRDLVDDRRKEIFLESQEGIYLLPYETHVIRYLENSDFIILKSYRYQDDKPDVFPCLVDA